MPKSPFDFLLLSPGERTVGLVKIELIRCPDGRFRAIVSDDSLGFGDILPSTEDGLLQALNLVIPTNVSCLIHR